MSEFLCRNKELLPEQSFLSPFERALFTHTRKLEADKLGINEFSIPDKSRLRHNLDLQPVRITNMNQWRQTLGLAREYVTQQKNIIDRSTGEGVGVKFTHRAPVGAISAKDIVEQHGENQISREMINALIDLNWASRAFYLWLELKEHNKPFLRIEWTSLKNQCGWIFAKWLAEVSREEARTSKCRCQQNFAGADLARSF